MTKADQIEALEQIETELKEIEKRLSKYPGAQIRQQGTKNEIQSIAQKWFEAIEKPIAHFGVTNDITTKYQANFNKLLEMAQSDSSKSRYLEVFGALLSSFRKDLIVPVLKHANDFSDYSHLDSVLASVSDEEKPLLQEAIDSAKAGYMRASVVLGWASAIYHMHKIVAIMSYDKFNAKSEEMSKIEDGRYKRYKKVFHVHNEAELQSTVFDNDLLWVLEYSGFFDYNQHERLSMCYVMRSTSAHPSPTKITPQNIGSFFSDLKTIVFDNPKFALPNESKSEDSSMPEKSKK